MTSPDGLLPACDNRRDGRKPAVRGGARRHQLANLLLTTFCYLALFLPGCAPVGQRYQLLPAPAGVTERESSLARRLILSGRVAAEGSIPAGFVYAEGPLGGVVFGAWNSCQAERDEMFYQGWRRDGTLELQTLGRYAEVRSFCGFSLASDGDNILLFGGERRPGTSLFLAPLRAQILILDPFRGTVRRLSPPRGFTRGLDRVFFVPQLGSYILKDHRGHYYRLRLP